VFRLGGAPIHDQPNRLSHLCYRTATGIRVVDVWRDEESFAAFGAVLGPAVTAAGLDTPPEIFPSTASWRSTASATPEPEGTTPWTSSAATPTPCAAGGGARRLISGCRT